MTEGKNRGGMHIFFMKRVVVDEEVEVITLLTKELGYVGKDKSFL